MAEANRVLLRLSVHIQILNAQIKIFTLLQKHHASDHLLKDFSL